MACPPPQPPNNPRGNKSVTRITSRVIIEEADVPAQSSTQSSMRTPSSCPQRQALTGGSRGSSTPYYTPRQCPPTPRTGGGRGAPTPYYTPRQYPATPRTDRSTGRMASTPYYTPNAWQASLRTTPNAWQASLRTTPNAWQASLRTPAAVCPGGNLRTAPTRSAAPSQQREGRRACPTPAPPPSSSTRSGQVSCPPLPMLSGTTCPSPDLNATFTVDDSALNRTYDVDNGGLNATYTVDDGGLNTTYDVGGGLNETYTVANLNDTYTVDDGFGQTYTLESSLQANVSSTPRTDVSFPSFSTDDSNRANLNYPSDYQYFSSQTASSDADSLAARVNYPSDYQYFSSQTASSDPSSTGGRVNYPSDYQYFSESSEAQSPPRETTSCPQEAATPPPCPSRSPKRYETPLATSSPARRQPTQPWRDSTSPVNWANFAEHFPQPGSPSSFQQRCPPLSYPQGTPTSFDDKWTAQADTPARSKRSLKNPKEVLPEFTQDISPTKYSPQSSYGNPPDSWGWQHSSNMHSTPPTFLTPYESPEQATQTPPIQCENRDPWSPLVRPAPSVPYQPIDESWSTVSSGESPPPCPPKPCPKKGAKKKINWFEVDPFNRRR